MKKPVLIGIVIVAAILGLLVYSSLNLTQHRVELCIEFFSGGKMSASVLVHWINPSSTIIAASVAVNDFVSEP